MLNQTIPIKVNGGEAKLYTGSLTLTHNTKFK